MTGSGNALGRLILQLRQHGFTGKIVGAEDIVSDGALSVIKNIKEGIYYVKLKSSPKATNLKKEYKEKYKIEMPDFALIAYNGLDLILSMLQEEGSFDNKKLMKYIENKEYIGYMGINYIENGEIMYDFEFTELNQSEK